MIFFASATLFPDFLSTYSNVLTNRHDGGTLLPCRIQIITWWRLINISLNFTISEIIIIFAQ